MVTTNNSPTAVHLPAHLVERVERRVSGTEFDSSAEYITFVLEEVLSRVEHDGEVENVIDKQEIENRLQSLGYIDR